MITTFKKFHQVVLAIATCVLATSCETTRTGMADSTSPEISHLATHTRAKPKQANPKPALPKNTMDVHVDARELPQGFLHSRMRISVQPGRVALWFPKWVPGTHGPTGRIRNIANLHFEDAAGNSLRWTRDEIALFRFLVDVPKGIHEITAHLSYICNQASSSSNPIDSHGGTPIGIINWNTCLLYPEKLTNDQLKVHLSLQLPTGWYFASALKTDAANLSSGQSFSFQPETFRTIVDSPLIAGNHFRTVPLRTKGGPPVHLHLVSEPASGLNIQKHFTASCRRLVTEAEALLGPPPYKAYQFLVASTDYIDSIGLEHLESSLNGIKGDALTAEKGSIGRPAHLLPHEYVHAWVGKYRRPKGMETGNYHSPKRTHLLWVYEGLTQYLGDVLAARSGLATKDAILERLNSNVSRLQKQTGRTWRSLGDTAVAGHTLRGGPWHWNTLRRGQDYYIEGALFWLEADIIIRALTHGQKNLDTFCKLFFGAHAQDGKVIPFDLDELVNMLNRVAPFEWHNLIEQRIYTPHPTLTLNAIRLAGYQVVRKNTPSKKVAAKEENSEHVNALDSIGIAVSSGGRIYTILNNSPAFKAGLVHEQYIVSVNEEKFSGTRLREALVACQKTGKIGLSIYDRGEIRTRVIQYKGGPVYQTLERDLTRPDILMEILSPKISVTKKE